MSILMQWNNIWIVIEFKGTFTWSIWDHYHKFVKRHSLTLVSNHYRNRFLAIWWSNLQKIYQWRFRDTSSLRSSRDYFSLNPIGYMSYAFIYLFIYFYYYYFLCHIPVYLTISWILISALTYMKLRCFLSSQKINSYKHINPKRAELFWPISQPQGGGFRPP